MKPINIKEKFNAFTTQWHPHQIAVVDDMQVLLAKVKDAFVWHEHKDEDELFYVQKGTLEMHFRNSTSLENQSHSHPERNRKEWVEIVKEGELIVVPKGVEHCPKTKNGEEVHLLLFEKRTTKHTGEVQHEKTQTSYPKI
ncbi:MAG: mannose-6-phosphate isomerase [Flavobacteriaceae bacterium]|nr:mannose-6-phosphate isomerase [Flavobacteriaceae bacterium]